MTFELGLFAVAVVAGAVASITGFGIGSLVTPVLMLRLPPDLAIALVGIPHAAATALRWIRLRPHTDWQVLKSFGLASAAGGLAGAMLQSTLRFDLIAVVFGALLVLSGVTALTGWLERIRVTRPLALVEGWLSGVFGGLAGNQGGIRSAALLAYPLEPQAFVATATASALLVDAARVPVYLATQGEMIWQHATWMGIATVGVVLGTLLGTPLLRRIPVGPFRRGVALSVLVLGAWLLVRALG